jgi:hypothetical protein
MKTTRRAVVCVESRPSMERTLYRSVESCPSCLTGHLWCMCRVFTPRAFVVRVTQGPYQRKISNLHLCTSLPTGLYASFRPKGSASLREGSLLARRGRSPSGIEYQRLSTSEVYKGPMIAQLRAGGCYLRHSSRSWCASYDESSADH